VNVGIALGASAGGAAVGIGGVHLAVIVASVVGMAAIAAASATSALQPAVAASVATR
jgi:hypothetical protein